MEHINQTVKLANEIDRDIKSIKDINTYGELDALEKKCVTGIQLLQIAASQVARDLYEQARLKRQELRSRPVATLVEAEEPVKEESKEEKPKAKRKTNVKSNKRTNATRSKRKSTKSA